MSASNFFQGDSKPFANKPPSKTFSKEKPSQRLAIQVHCFLISLGGLHFASSSAAWTGGSTPENPQNMMQTNWQKSKVSQSDTIFCNTKQSSQNGIWEGKQDKHMDYICFSHVKAKGTLLVIRKTAPHLTHAAPHLRLSVNGLSLPWSFLAF